MSRNKIFSLTFSIYLDTCDYPKLNFQKLYFCSLIEKSFLIGLSIGFSKEQDVTKIRIYKRALAGS